MYTQMNQTKGQNKIMQVNVQSVIRYRLSQSSKLIWKCNDQFAQLQLFVSFINVII